MKSDIRYRMMKYFIENIKDLKKNPMAWWITFKIYIITKFMSAEEKNEILIKAKNQSEIILINRGLNISFNVCLETEKDLYFRTVAMYQIGSSKKGVIKIYIKSHLIGNEINRIVQFILHEVAHAVYEEGFTRDLTIGREILRQKKFYSNLNLELPQDNSIFNMHYDKEKFCEWFSICLMNETMFNKDKEGIDKIIQNFNQLNAPAKRYGKTKIV